ncbi:MAG TPA: sulfocyanin-like copper-binding protein [Gemmatimonadaceae bacterium]|nr:sulfocyanin-like copper-binding protein [Gemmatimonadaceae bacterium]
MGVFMAGGCARSDAAGRGGDDAAEARADSSAAGYDVGPAPASGTASAAPASSGGAGDARRPAAAAPAPSPPPSGPAPRARDRVGVATHPVRTPRAVLVRPPGGASDSSGIAGPVRVNEFLRYHIASRTAELRIVSGYNGANEGLNLNGGARGDQTVVVPAGWTIRLLFVNSDGEQPHSAIVAAGDQPAGTLRAAFPGAAAAARAELGEGEAAEVRFAAARSGSYVVACGIPGHAQAGEWIRLRVSATATEPTYQ